MSTNLNWTTHTCSYLQTFATPAISKVEFTEIAINKQKAGVHRIPHALEHKLEKNPESAFLAVFAKSPQGGVAGGIFRSPFNRNI